MSNSHLPIRFDLHVPSNGHVEVELPTFAGSQVTVSVVEHQDDGCGDLLAAASTSTDFWDNPEDDEDWNNA
jgi:hypothetical protein